jgi:tRNA1Val (adenine37-N6)-methyltransferase
MSNIRLEEIGGGFSIEVTKDHGFNIDSLLLARFASPRFDEQACDLGTGCGIIPLLWCRQQPSPMVAAVEIQYEAAEMARRSVARCGVDDRVTVYHADLRDWNKILESGSQDLVTINPPYFASGTGVISKSPAARIARHEGEGCSFLDAANAAYGLLKQGGRFCFCHRPERLIDVLETLKNSRLIPKHLVFAYHSPKSEPWLFLCEARKGGSKGLKIMPPFISKDFDGNPTDDYNSLYQLERT